MTINTSFNPAGNLVTTITKNNTTISFFQDRFNMIDIFITSKDFAKKGFHKSTNNEVFLNKTIATLKNTGNLDHILK